MNWLTDTVKQLPKGVFLMVEGNPMTIGWAQFGVLWGKQTCSVYVRHSRCTHELLDHAQTFTISVPKLHAMSNELAVCGTKSGRDVNKLEATGMHLLPNQYGAQDGLLECRYQIECRILFRADLDEHTLEDASLLSRYYAHGDPHTMYVGEILGVSEQDV